MFGFPDDSPEKMRETIEGYFKYITIERPDLPSAILTPKIIECDPSTPRLTVAYPIKEGMLNAIGNAHGAMITMAYDVTMGIMARWHQQGTMSPTLTMSFEFLKAVPVGSNFVCEFFRYGTKLWLGCSNLAFHALFMCIVGIIALIVISGKQKAKQLTAVVD